MGVSLASFQGIQQPGQVQSKLVSETFFKANYKFGTLRLNSNLSVSFRRKDGTQMFCQILIQRTTCSSVQRCSSFYPGIVGRSSARGRYYN